MVANVSFATTATTSVVVAVRYATVVLVESPTAYAAMTPATAWSANLVTTPHHLPAAKHAIPSAWPAMPLRPTAACANKAII